MRVTSKRLRESHLEENPKKCQNQLSELEQSRLKYSFPGSSMVEWAAVNRLVAGSSPARGALISRLFIWAVFSKIEI